MSDAAASLAASLPVVERVVRCIAQTAVDNESHFCALDSVVGDGDFGFSLARGFEKVLAEFDTLDRSSVSGFLKKVAVIITSRCGGTSGPIWGTAFLRAGAAATELPALGPAEVVVLLRAAFNGTAALGDKTLLDALGPFTDCFEREAVASKQDPLIALERAVEAAEEAARATSELVAKRGRAAYTGERSRGSVDPGATALAVIARRVCGSLREVDA
jgi:phosphoenolpyruvate---glycerone phosphotransferase subunit DhaL